MTAEIQAPRVVGLDVHPDTFTAAILRGPTPAAAVVEKTFNHVPLGQLSSWAQKQTTAQDQLVLEASGNSFQVVRILAAVERQAKVLESGQMGKLKEAHANNDRISAVRIGKAYLAGTAKEVWVPDPVTQERRDWFHAHRKAVKRTTQMRNRLRSYFSDQGVRLPRGLALATDRTTTEKLKSLHSWTDRQWQVVEIMLLELRHAEEQRAHWRSLIAQEVLADEKMLSLVRLCGVRDLIAFALMAIIGNIKRFKGPKQLVKYIGLNPAFDDSGEGTWEGGIGGHGRKDLRALLIEAAQALLRSHHPLAAWGRKLMHRKSSLPLAVAAVARKLTVAIWYLLQGRWTALQEIDAALARKVGKIISQVGAAQLKARGQTRKSLREAAFQSLQSTQIYILDPQQTPPSANKPGPKIYILHPQKKMPARPPSSTTAVAVADPSPPIRILERPKKMSARPPSPSVAEPPIHIWEPPKPRTQKRQPTKVSLANPGPDSGRQSLQARAAKPRAKRGTAPKKVRSETKKA
jgi:transposase